MFEILRGRTKVAEGSIRLGILKVRNADVGVALPAVLQRARSDWGY